MASSNCPPKCTITEHPRTPYISLTSSLPMSQLPSLADGISQLFAVFSTTSPPSYPAGPPFFKYVAMPTDMAANQHLDMEVGLPVSAQYQLPGGSTLAQAGNNVENIELKLLPAGTYLETTHIGPPGGLQAATKGLLDYAEREKLKFDVLEDEGILARRDEGGNLEVGRCEKDVWVAR